MSIVCSLLLLSIPGLVHAQEREHRLYGGAGAAFTTVRDQLASPLTFAGSAPWLALGYDLRSSRFQHTLEAEFTWATNPSNRLTRSDAERPFSNEPSMASTRVDVRYRLLHTLWRPHPSLRIAAGGSWNATMHFREYFYTPTRSELSWDVRTALNVAPYVHWTTGDNAFEAGASLPLLAYINRPPYAIEGDPIFDALFDRNKYLSLGRVEHLLDFREVALHTGFSRRITTNLSGTMRMQWNYFRYDEPERTASVFRTIHLLLGYRWDS